MEFIGKLEKTVLGWSQNIPHLPQVGRKWLGENAWWIVMVGAILSGIVVLFEINGFFRQLAALSTPSNSYYVTSDYTSVAIVDIVVNAAFVLAVGLLLAFAVKPLQRMQKKGWVLVFFALLVEALYVVVHAVLSFSIVGFVVNLLFGAIGLEIGAIGVAIAAYFIIEAHGQFGRPPKRVVRKAPEQA